jgi:hypothetical protein
MDRAMASGAMRAGSIPARRINSRILDREGRRLKAE